MLGAGVFVVSLDFELYWGVRDKKSIESYSENLLGVRKAVPAILELFHQFGIHATWATVGFLFFSSREELLNSLPVIKPDYRIANYSPYQYLSENPLGSTEREDPYHFAPSLIKLIRSYPHQRIGSHTFSHYYCLEEGQTVESFQADLDAAIQIAKRHQLKLESIVFPRNQCNSEYLKVCRALGIQSFRGNALSWLYRASPEDHISLIRRGIRLLDAYMNLSGHHCYALQRLGGRLPINIPSSRFLRPFSKKFSYLEPLRLRRIQKDMEFAAKNGLMYHLWWHPHNFGANVEENVSFLRSILEHYKSLHDEYGMESLNMEELTELLTEKQPMIAEMAKG